MQLLDDLRREHELIEKVALALRGYAERSDAPFADAVRFVEFFQVYAGHWHHEREETVLVPLLTDVLGLPQRGPIAVLLHDHASMAELLVGMKALALRADESERPHLRELAIRYVYALLQHIDAENSVLFPESEQRLRSGGVREVASRELTEPEREAIAIGESLIATYPAFADPELFRGEGCVMCPQFGEQCRGIEREWWNDWEWEEHSEHVASS